MFRCLLKICLFSYFLCPLLILFDLFHTAVPALDCIMLGGVLLLLQSKQE